MFSFTKPPKSAPTAAVVTAPTKVTNEPKVPATANQDRIIAVIGTAGRDKNRIMDADLWRSMCQDLKSKVTSADHLVSGGAAWADHLAVHAYLEGWVSNLTLFLPAPMKNGQFSGPRSSAASAANFYHEKFERAIGVKTLAQIEQARQKGAQVLFEAEAPGYGAMFARNNKVAKMANNLIAYTFGEGEEPADGGTLHTWKQATFSHLVHVPLGNLVQKMAQTMSTTDVQQGQREPVLARPNSATMDSQPQLDLLAASAPMPEKRFSFKHR